jgi:dUTP pyrophosphatase
MKPVTVRVLKLDDVPLPTRQTSGAAGYDLCSAETKAVGPRSFALVRTGIAIELPSGYEAQVRPRSGMAAKHGIGILNSPGTIDSDYRGEIKVILFNLSSRSFRVRRGDRIAQVVFGRIAEVSLKPAKKLAGTRRGPGGFGHTG